MALPLNVFNGKSYVVVCENILEPILHQIDHTIRALQQAKKRIEQGIETVHLGFGQHEPRRVGDAEDEDLVDDIKKAIKMLENMK